MPIAQSSKVAAAWQAVRPNHTFQLGSGTGADCAITDTNVTNSDAAPHDGLVIVSIPDGLTIRVRIGASATATANDQAYYGPSIWHWPILDGERVSMYGDGAAGTVTVSMAQ